MLMQASQALCDRSTYMQGNSLLHVSNRGYTFISHLFPLPLVLQHTDPISMAAYIQHINIWPLTATAFWSLDGATITM